LIARIKLAARSSLGERWWLWAGIAGIGVITNFGTALLRLKVFIPFPRLLDFSSYYVGAWSMRLGLSPYDRSPELLEMLSEQHGLADNIALHHSPPLWAWLLQPLTLLRFAVAAWIWLGMLIGVLLLCTRLLLRLAGYSGWKPFLLVFLSALTFGPTFLSLTIGQNSLFIVLGALAVGWLLRRRTANIWITALSWLVAAAAKVYPFLWLAALPFARHWRLLTAALILGVVGFGAVAALNPGASRDYWFDFIPGRAAAISEEVNVDDQALSAWLTRLGRTGTYSFAGLDVSRRQSNTWTAPVQISQAAIQATSIVILALLAVAMVVLWHRANHPIRSEGMFYMIVLFSLLPFPHMERYNHVLLMPAMAWLWYQGRPYKCITILVYALVGLARLNHLWAMILAWPWGPLASGLSLYAVFLLIGGIGHRIRSAPEVRPTPLTLTP
jgi:hypothetical protein